MKFAWKELIGMTNRLKYIALVWLLLLVVLGVIGTVAFRLVILPDYYGVVEGELANGVTLVVWKENAWDINCAYYVELINNRTSLCWWYAFALDSDGKSTKVTVSISNNGDWCGVFNNGECDLLINTKSGFAISDERESRVSTLTKQVALARPSPFRQPCHNAIVRGEWSDLRVKSTESPDEH